MCTRHIHINILAFILVLNLKSPPVNIFLFKPGLSEIQSISLFISPNSHISTLKYRPLRRIQLLGNCLLNLWWDAVCIWSCSEGLPSQNDLLMRSLPSLVLFMLVQICFLPQRKRVTFIGNVYRVSLFFLQ